MTFPWIAVAGALAALTACGAGSGHQAGATVGNRATTGVAAGSAQPAGTGAWPTTPSSPAPTSPARGTVIPAAAIPAAAVPTAAIPGISDADLAQLDQRLADASNSLNSADQAVTHNESGDSTP